MFRSDRLANAAVKLSCIVMAMDEGQPSVEVRDKSSQGSDSEREMEMTPIDSGLDAEGRWMERTELEADSAPGPSSESRRAIRPYFKSGRKMVDLAIFG